MILLLQVLHCIHMQFWIRCHASVLNSAFTKAVQHSTLTFFPNTLWAPHKASACNLTKEGRSSPHCRERGAQSQSCTSVRGQDHSYPVERVRRIWRHDAEEGDLETRREKRSQHASQPWPHLQTGTGNRAYLAAHQENEEGDGSP